MHAPSSSLPTTDWPGFDHTRWISVTCQVCGCGRADQVLVETFECPTGRRSGALRLCPECGFLFAEQRELPGRGPRRPSSAPTSDAFASFVHAELSAEPHPIGRLLDARAFSGELLRQLQDVSKSRLGLEADAASATASPNAAELSPVSLEANRLVPESVDTVTALGLFECSADVRATLQEIERLLVPHGTLFVCVPDALTLADDPRRALVYGDVGHFTRSTLSRLLRDFGLRVEAERTLADGRICLKARKESRTALWGLCVGDTRELLRLQLRTLRTEREALREKVLSRWWRENAVPDATAPTPESNASAAAEPRATEPTSSAAHDAPSNRALPRNIVLVGETEAVRFVLDTLDIRERVRLSVTPKARPVPYLELPVQALEDWQPSPGDLVLSCSPCALAWTPDELFTPETRHVRLFPERPAAA